MDPEVRAEFDEMREARRRAMERMDAAEKRMEKFDLKLEAMRNWWGRGSRW
jgi:hypothetical protein